MKDVLIYTVHKAASMFLHKIAGDIAKEYKIDYFSINQPDNFDAIKSTSWMEYASKNGRHGIFGPIRAGEAEPNIPTEFRDYRAILHLRDPRDVLVSLFYSNVYSHPNAGGFTADAQKRKSWEDIGVDAFVLSRSAQFREYYNSLIQGVLNEPGVIFVKYETMVNDYERWLTQFMSAFEEFPVPIGGLASKVGLRKTREKIFNKLLSRYKDDFTIADENIKKHKRQIVPGDHARKLRPETIEKLNVELSDVLKTLNYI